MTLPRKPHHYTHTAALGCYSCGQQCDIADTIPHAQTVYAVSGGRRLVDNLYRGIDRSLGSGGGTGNSCQIIAISVLPRATAAARAGSNSGRPSAVHSAGGQWPTQFFCVVALSAPPGDARERGRAEEIRCERPSSARPAAVPPSGGWVWSGGGQVASCMEQWNRSSAFGKRGAVHDRGPKKSTHNPLCSPTSRAWPTRSKRSRRSAPSPAARAVRSLPTSTDPAKPRPGCWRSSSPSSCGSSQYVPEYGPGNSSVGQRGGRSLPER